MAESRFPIVFDKCPLCGCTETLTRLAWDEEAEKGRVNKDTPVAAEHIATPLIDPMRPPKLSASFLLQHFDTCAGCGMSYCKKAEIGTGPVTMKQMPPGMQGPSMPPGFGRG